MYTPKQSAIYNYINKKKNGNFKQFWDMMMNVILKKEREIEITSTPYLMAMPARVSNLEIRCSIRPLLFKSP